MIRRSIVALAFLLGACGASESTEPAATTPNTPVPTVPGVGNLPDTVPAPNVEAGVRPVVEIPPSVEITRPVDDDGAVLDTVAEQVNGNRLLAIGDSILASTSTRYGGEMCTALNPLGWDVEVDAEPGRSVEFGNEVLADRLPDGVSADADFDAAVVHLGSNYRENRDDYYDELSEILFRIAPRPTLVMNVTEYRPNWAEVNEVIDELAALYDNVTVIDWEEVSMFPGVLSGDGLHPGNQGEAVLVDLLAVALGTVSDEEGECLSTSYTDDSLVGRGSGTGSGGSSSDFSTDNSSSSGSSSGGSSSGGSSSGGSSSGGSSTGGSSSGGSTGGGSTDGGDGGGGSTDGGDGSTDGGGGSTDGGGSTGGGSTDGGGGSDGGSTGGGSSGGGDGGSSGGGSSGGGSSGGGSSGGGDGGSSGGGDDGSSGGGSSGGGAPPATTP